MFAQIVLFGDSLTQQSFSLETGGWAAELSNSYQRRADFLNRGFSGYNTDWARLILPQLISKDNLPDVVVLFWGANDSSLAELNPHQHVPVKRYKDNLGAMCDYLLDTGLSKTAIILVTPPPVHEGMWLEHNQDKDWVSPDRVNSVTRLYADAVEQLGAERGIDTVHLYTEMEQKEDLGGYLSDGLHMSEAGNALVASLLKHVMEQKLASTEQVFPDWKETNVDKLKTAVGV